LGHFAVYTKIGDDIEVRGFWPRAEGLPNDPEELFKLLTKNPWPGRVQNDLGILDDIGIEGVAHASRSTTLEEAQKLRSLLGESGARDVHYSLNPDDFENAFNCVTWGCKQVNDTFGPSIESVRQGRVSKIFDVITNLPSPWKVVIGGR
jgi:hypothetical protein